MHHNIYFDETCKNDNFFIYGGCIFADSIMTHYKESIKNKCVDLGIHINEEVKWTKTNRYKLHLHKFILDEFFKYLDEGKAVALMVGINNRCEYTRQYKRDNSPTEYLGKLIHNLLKFDLFQYALTRNKIYKNDDTFSLFLDHDSSIDEKEIQIASYAINNEYSKVLHAKADSNYFIRSTECVNSKKHKLLQISDVIMGGIGYLVNEKQKYDSMKPKSILAMYLFEKLQERNLFDSIHSLQVGNKPWENASFSFRIFKPCLSKKARNRLNSQLECTLRGQKYGCK